MKVIDEDERFLTFNDFKERFKIKHSLFQKKEQSSNNGSDLK